MELYEDLNCEKSRSSTEIDIETANFSVHMEELDNNNVPGKSDENAYILNRASSSKIDYSISDAGEDFSDVMKLQISNGGKIVLANEEDTDSCRPNEIKIQPTLPIYLKFQDVKFKITKMAIEDVKSSDEDKYILHGITG
ncbi:hypothetical protein ACOSQ4_009760 [Xanthoceras sorbifolium]